MFNFPLDSLGFLRPFFGSWGSDSTPEWPLSSRAYRPYAQSVSMKNNALSTSLRSDAQATDSTYNGCHEKSAATNALRHNSPVIPRSTRKTRTEYDEYSSRMTK